MTSAGRPAQPVSPHTADTAPVPWRCRPCWRVLDTCFGDGLSFLATWQQWAADTGRPTLLHYVAIAAVAPSGDAVLQQLSTHPQIACHAAELEQQWFGLLPGFHRIVLQRGRVLLTLCIGPLQAMLREQQFVADTIHLSDSPANDRRETWALAAKPLARLCRRGTQLRVHGLAPPLRDALVQAGFVLAPDAGPARPGAPTVGEYQPHWQLRSSRSPWRVEPPAVSTCAVVGAGLAGATVAAALARRGWQVLVLDAADQPAAGASGLPVGLLVPAVSRDDNPRSRLSRAGVRVTLHACRSLLREGEHWGATGVLELQREGLPALPGGWPTEGDDWSLQAGDDLLRRTWGDDGGSAHSAALQHVRAGWIRPARLVQACLAQPGVRFVGRSRVQSLGRQGSNWLLLGDQSQELASVPHLVLACATDTERLLNAAIGSLPAGPARASLAPMPAVAGQMSWAMHTSTDAAHFPAGPVNGRGSFVARIPVARGQAWFAGATYEAVPQAIPDETGAHRDNLRRLSELLPSVAAQLVGTFGSANLHAWRGTRCTTVDRLPLAGPWDTENVPGLWLSAGMGSRGLTYAVLCAELIAAQLGGEPLPVEASLRKALDPYRARLRADSLQTI